MTQRDWLRNTSKDFLAKSFLSDPFRFSSSFSLDLVFFIVLICYSIGFSDMRQIDHLTLQHFDSFYICSLILLSCSHKKKLHVTSLSLCVWVCVDKPNNWSEWASRERTLALVREAGCETWHAVWKAWQEWSGCLETRFCWSCHFCQRAFGQRGKTFFESHLSYNILFTQSLYLQVEMSGCIGPITTFIVEPFIPHNEEFYLNVVSDRLGYSISFSECGGIEIEENWDKVSFVQCLNSVFHH